MSSLLYELLSFMRLIVKYEDNYYFVIDYDTKTTFYETPSIDDLLSYLVEELSYHFLDYHLDYTFKGGLNILEIGGVYFEKEKD